MKRKLVMLALVMGVLSVSAITVIAAPSVINITRRLGGVASNVFVLDGTLRLRSLVVHNTLDAKYDNTTSRLKATTYKGAIDEL
ncbi:MAG: hypothetical protein HY975_02350, partial [Candidatus Kerfeldbacteria bacterium]|nr:hypothetical protein [Candidatus Kerfeldbacteria bacterium]